MKKNLPILLFLFSILFYSAKGQTYVNHSSSGANDGSSWEDAYTDLNTAIENTTSGEIWVAKGTYKPSGDGVNSTFYIQNSISLYGGFDGTETSINDRDIGNNLTNLNGDHDGNDIDLEFDSIPRSDNSIHVVVVDSLLTEVTIDGFHITNGNTLNDGDLPYFMRAGGGIFSYSTIHVSKCEFNNNFGRTGACISLIDGAHNSTFNQIRITQNQTTSQSAGIYMRGLDNISISNSEFTLNRAIRGAVYPALCSNVSLTNCSFRENYSDIGGFGAGLFVWNNTELLIEDCEFIGNSTSSAGGIYIDGREISSLDDNVTINNCTFEDNNALDGYGAALYTWKLSYTLSNCSFTNNRATGNAGAIHNGGEEELREITISNTSFLKNRGNFGGAVTAYGEGGNISFIDCEFERNRAEISGGSAINGFGSTVLYSNTTFEKDSARFGGSMSNQNNGSVVIESCSFDGNEAAGNSGAINILFGVDMTIDDSKFESNLAVEYGGVINANLADDTIQGSLTINNSEFYYNSVEVQGGAINTNNFNVDITNSVFAFNDNFGTGAGGAISINATAGNSSLYNITNTTFTENFAEIGSGIAAYTDGDNTAYVELGLQNNIFHNENGKNFEVEDGDPIIVSKGGNIATDASLEDYLDGTNDISNGNDPEFVDIDDLNFVLTEGSPAIDIGITDGAPSTDIEGNPRFNEPDAGAFEFQDPDNIAETILKNKGLLKINPNPVSSALSYELSTTWKGPISVLILDITGKTYLSQNIVKKEETETFHWNIDGLQAGAYILVVKQNDKAVLAKMIKL